MSPLSRRFLGVVGVLLQAVAWLVFLCAAGLFAFEETGWLTEVVRGELRKRLGPLSGDVGVENVRLKWFEPGLLIEGLTLRGEVEEETELLHLSSLHVGFTGYRSPGIRSIRAQDGRIRVSSELFQTIDRIRERWSTGGAGRPAPPPPILAEGIEIVVELEKGPLHAGKIRMTAEGAPEGAFHFRGSIRPEWVQAADPSSDIEVEGHRDPDGIVVRVAADSIRLASGDLELPFDLPPLPVAAWEGRLSFDASLHFDPQGRSEPRGSLRASVDSGSVLWRADRPPLRDLSVELEARGRAASLDGLARLESWTARSCTHAKWIEKPVEAWGLFEPGSGGDPTLRVFARVEELALDVSTLEALGGSQQLREPFEALEPRGIADASVDLSLRRELHGGVPEWKPSFAVHMRHIGRSWMTFQGFRSVTGERIGLPVPCSALNGQVLFVRDDRLAVPLRLAFVNFKADHPSGIVHGWAQLTAADRGGELKISEFDLVFDAPDVAIDDRLRSVLEKSPLTSNVVSTYDPRGGTAHATWRFREGPETSGFSAAGRVEVQETTLQWKEIPIPMEGTSGELNLLWARRASFVSDQAQRKHRPFGITYSFQNDGGGPEHPGTRARVRGFARQVSLPATVMASDIPGHMIQAIELEIPELRLRGRDFDNLGERFPELRIQRDEQKVSGSMRVVFRGVRPDPDDAWASDVEAVPGLLQIQPRFFQRNTEDIRGRILVHGESGGPKESVETRLDLSGRWPGDVELAIHGILPSQGTAEMQVFGAGIDPTNNAFQGALVNVLSRDENRSGVRLDLTQSRLAGRIDFGVRSKYESEAEDARLTVVRVFLRDNTLGHGSLELGRMHGVLEQSGSVLESPLVTAALAGHPVELRNVLVFPLQEAERTPGVDPLLRRAGYPPDLAGLALQAELHTRDLPLDEAHLRSFVDPEFLRGAQTGSERRGRIDVLGARILLTGPKERAGILLVRGPLELQDLSLRLGLPITILSAKGELEEFAFEEQRFRGWARVDDLDALIAGRSLSDASMIVGYVDGRLTLDALSGDFEREGAKGRLASLGQETGARKALGVDLADPFRFDVALELQSVPVDRLLRGVFPSSIADEGFLDASLQIAGTPDDVLGLHGRGRLHLTEGKLWSIPVIRELFSQLGFDQTLSFDEFQARFELREGVLLTPLLEIKSPLVNLVGNGWIDLDGRVHFDLDVRYGLLDRLGFLNRILYWMNRKIWRVAVRGNVSRPQVIIRTSLLGFFRGSEEPSRKLLPLPPLSPLPPRF